MLFCFSFATFAETKSIVAAKQTKILTQNTTMIEVTVDHLINLMGFKINVKYDPELIDMISISRGDITKTGNFTSNFGTIDGPFDVLWNNTEPVTEGKTLFTLGLKAKKYFDSQEIQLSYSQGDTFDQNYDDVVFECKSIIVTCKKDEQKTMTSKQELTEQPAEYVNQLSQQELLDVIHSTMKEMKIDSILDLDDKNSKEFLDTLNSNISEITKNRIIVFDKLNSLIRFYKNAYNSMYIETTAELVDPQYIKAAVEAAMKQNSVSDIQSVETAQEKSFVKSVEHNLKALNPDVPDLIGKVEDEDALTTIKQLYGNYKLIDSAEDYTPPSRNNIWIYLCIGLVVLIIASVAFIAFRKKKVK